MAEPVETLDRLTAGLTALGAVWLGAALFALLLFMVSVAAGGGLRR